MVGVKHVSLISTLLVGLAATLGCAVSGPRTVWRPPVLASPGAPDPQGKSPEDAEAAYAIGVQAESDDSAACVDFYYQSALHCWNRLQQDVAVGAAPSTRTTSLYQSAVTRLLTSAQRFGRWNPRTGLMLQTDRGLATVPVRFHGFVWEPVEFQQLVPVGEYDDPKLSREFRSQGLGVPLVVVRHTAIPQPFTQARQEFAATALLRGSSDPSGGWLEFYDPLRVSETCVAGRPLALARDLSAPFAYAGRSGDRQWLTDFLLPGTDGATDGLFMIEPYQPGKVPVVFVHGLLSDPESWVDLVNELRSRPGLNDGCQWWAFRYATGKPFLESAALLRRQLAEIRCVYDPLRTEAAMSNLALVGHSMGGLVAKLQVAESGDLLWRSIAAQPFDTVRTTPETRLRLRQEFFFHPSNDVARVVFIGTPHLGSTWARRPIGRLGSALVEPSARDQAEFAQLLRDNPGLLQREDVRRLPTSIDLLEPDSPVLAATAALPLSPRVTYHSIVGAARTAWDGEPSDGVVPLSSARLCGVASERGVDATHTRLLRYPDCVAEVERILRDHLAALSLCGAESLRGR